MFFLAGGGQNELRTSAYCISPARRHLCEPELCLPGWTLELEAGSVALVCAQGPGAVNARDREASWRELLGIHPPASPGPGGQSPPTFLMEIGREDHAVIRERMAPSPTKVKRSSRPDLAVLLGSCLLFPSSVSGGIISFSEVINGMIYLKSLVPGRKEAFKGQLLLRF